MHDQRRVERPEGSADDAVAIEEPLEIRVETEPVAVLMRTPGHDHELVRGFLRSEGVISDPDDLAALATIAENVVDVRLATGVEATVAQRRIVTSSACGICGRATLEEVERTASGALRPHPFEEAWIAGLVEQLRHGQDGFRSTGGLHGAALAHGPDVRAVREDVGRHNAVDKVLGWELDEGGGGTLIVSSRAGFEIVQKARMAGIPTVVALGAATTLAIDLARSQGMRLYGFADARRYNRYS